MLQEPHAGDVVIFEKRIFLDADIHAAQYQAQKNALAKFVKLVKERSSPDLAPDPCAAPRISKAEERP